MISLWPLHSGTYCTTLKCVHNNCFHSNLIYFLWLTFWYDFEFQYMFVVKCCQIAEKIVKNKLHALFYYQTWLYTLLLEQVQMIISGQNMTSIPYNLFFLFFFSIRLFYSRFYPLHLFPYLNSWERASISLFNDQR